MIRRERGDPPLALGQAAGDETTCRAAITASVIANPQVRYADAMLDSVDAVHDEARMRWLFDALVGIQA